MAWIQGFSCIQIEQICNKLATITGAVFVLLLFLSWYSNMVARIESSSTKSGESLFVHLHAPRSLPRPRRRARFQRTGPHVAIIACFIPKGERGHCLGNNGQ